ncbi:MAG: hypothetical protein KKE50_06865 [Nanoarchaeota archaeon]|nr:hypothetical protein [Nanoarchaeota archaeon]
MPNQAEQIEEGRNLGKAITVLGLEDELLSNGHLVNYPLLTRGGIANGIIDAKLRLGRWSSVVDMIFGGFGKADALYEGDKDKLRQGILESARRNSSDPYFGDKTVSVLLKSKEYDLLFNLSHTLPLRYEDFVAVVHKIPDTFFQEQGVGAERKQTFNSNAAEKALSERKYGSAIEYYRRASNLQALSTVFEEVLAEKAKDSSGSYDTLLLHSELEAILTTDERLKPERVKRVLASCKEKPSDAQFALRVYIEHKPEMTEQEQEAFYTKVAKNLSPHDIFNIQDRKTHRTLDVDPKLKLIWAKQHAKDNPRTAYQIFVEQKYNGSELVEAVNAGLEMDSYQNKERFLSPSNVQEAHLRAAFPSAPIKAKTAIARKLKDATGLQALSIQAQQAGNFRRAYDLWEESGAGFEGKYMDSLRTKMIADGIKYHEGSLIGVSPRDKTGREQAFDALMQAGETDRQMYLKAYDIALEGERLDAERLDKVRKTIVSVSPTRALRVFRGYNEEKVKDPEGVDYFLGEIARQTGADKSHLAEIAEKYLKD